MAAALLKHAEGIAQVITKASLERFTLGVAGHDSAAGALRVVQVARFRADVEVAQHAEGFPLLALHVEIAAQAIEPGQFVGVLLGAHLRTIGHIEIQHPHALHPGADHPFLFAELLRGLIAGQQGVKADQHLFERFAAEECHAVVTLLAADHAAVAGFFHDCRRKLRVFHLGFLQPQHIGLGLLQPTQQVALPAADRIDIPSCDPHAQPALKFAH